VTAATAVELRCAGEAMVTHPAVHGPAATVGELRAFFRDEHVHMALLVEAGVLVGVVERADLPAQLGDDTLARSVATLEGKTIRPETALTDAVALMRRGARRRLAVTSESSLLLGLLCLKASGVGFCSDADVRARRC
jgi:CBS domain-containing protein